MKLKMESVTAGYESDVVLQGLSLEVAEGEFLSLLGPSGCGKTTLMKVIAGILPVRKGRIFLNDRNITDLPIHKRGTVVVFQDMRLFPHKSVLENVAFPLKLRGVPKAQRQRQAAFFLEKVQMLGFENRKPGALSGGQQQRVALARALAAQPKLLLLDEPFSALDENLREDMRRLVLQLQKEFGMTVILVTHDREEALSMSDRIALMFDGMLIQTGTPKEVYERPASIRAADYFGNCIYIPGSASAGIFTAPGIRCPAAIADGTYRLMLRPDCLDPLTPGSYPVTVEEVRFRGPDTQVLFRSADGIVWTKSCPAAPPFRPGDSLMATLVPHNPVFFSE